MVARFLFQKNHFSVNNKRVKYNAFMPNAKGSTSVFIIRNQIEEDIWVMGNVAGQARGLQPLARADLSFAMIEGASLIVAIDDDPPNHANIVGWPTSKDEQIARAQELARVATLVERPA